MRYFLSLSVVLTAVCVAVSGCAPPPTADNEQNPELKPVIGQTTDEIGEFDPNAPNQVANPEPEVGGMFTYALEAYGPAVGKISKFHITQAVNMYWAEHGEYPPTYEVFMEEIIKKNRIELPVLPGDARYEYDVENHELVIVAPKKQD